MRANTLTALLLSFASATAFAGRGSSNAALQDAISSNSTDAIVSELERAEFLACVSCLDTVAPLVDHQSVKVREAAVWWLERRGVRDGVREMALTRLKGNDPTLAMHGAEALGTMRHPDAIPALSAYLAAPLDAASGAAAAKALGTIGYKTAIPALTQALSAAQPEIRLASVMALRQIRGNLDPMPLLPLLSDTDEKVRNQAVYTVGAFRDKRGVAPLIAVLGGDASGEVRKNAAWALGQIGDLDAVPALVNAKTDKDTLVAGMAYAALARMQ
jgi:hypothetical protein